MGEDGTGERGGKDKGKGGGHIEERGSERDGEK